MKDSKSGAQAETTGETVESTGQAPAKNEPKAPVEAEVPAENYYRAKLMTINFASVK